MIRSTVERGGKLIIPRLCHRSRRGIALLDAASRTGRRIPILPVYVNSPMANEALKFYAARTSELDEDMRPTEKKVSTFATTRFQTVASPQQSKAHGQPETVNRDLVERHGNRRSCVASHGGRVAGRAEHRAVRRVSGRWHTRPPARGWRARRQDSRTVDCGARADREDRLYVGARRPRRNSPLARHAAVHATRLCLVHGEPGPMDGLKTSYANASVGPPRPRDTSNAFRSNHERHAPVSSRKCG